MSKNESSPSSLWLKDGTLYYFANTGWQAVNGLGSTTDPDDPYPDVPKNPDGEDKDYGEEEWD